MCCLVDFRRGGKWTLSWSGGIIGINGEEVRDCLVELLECVFDLKLNDGSTSDWEIESGIGLVITRSNGMDEGSEDDFCWNGNIDSWKMTSRDINNVCKSR